MRRAISPSERKGNGASDERIPLMVFKQASNHLAFFGKGNTGLGTIQKFVAISILHEIATLQCLESFR
jgi:hypothetical protein